MEPDLINSSTDRSLSLLFDMLSNRNYTVIYATTPEISASDSHDAKNQYEMSGYDQPLHTDLKRDIQTEPLELNSNETLIDGPLFERYQFFTPGKLQLSLP